MLSVVFGIVFCHNTKTFPNPFMSVLTRNSTIDAPSSAVLARIEAQDEGYSVPLREFLHESGCGVEVNQGGSGPVTYWIGVGDEQYVKSLIAGHMPSAQKRLCILYDGQLDPREVARLHIKLALVDPVPLTSQATRRLFAFLFTGRTPIYNDRKGLGSHQRVSVIPKQSAREQFVSPTDPDGTDVFRISHIMRQVFVPTAPRDHGTHYFFPIAGGVLAAVLFPFVIYFCAFFLGAVLLYFSSTSLISGNTVWANRLLEFSRGYTQSASAMLETGAIIFDHVGIARIAQDQESLLGLLNDAAKSEVGVLRIIETGKLLTVGLLDPTTHTDSSVGLSDVIALRSDVSLVSQNLALVQAQLDSLLASGRFPFRLFRVQTFGHRALDAVVALRKMIEVSQRLLTLYPEIGGFKQPQTYLVLLQNSMELRPTGGFIGSVLVVSFSDGVLTDREVQDVYVADGQLKGHVDPPAAIRDMLGQEHWYLRDSNWDPDFAKSAVQAAWFYEKEMGTHVDGVVALSLPMVTRLLAVTGPLELPDFNERISSSNFFAKSLLYTQANFFPGSTQKKDFLGSLTNALILHITGDRSLQAGKLLSAISSSLDAKDIQFYFTNPTVESVISQWNWAGGVGFAPCVPVYRDSLCVGDGVGIVEANLGVNKVNYFMKQEALSHIQFLDNGTIVHELTVTMKNTSTNQMHDGGGTYQAYMRFLYPQDTDIVGVSIDGQPLSRADESNKTASASSSMVVEQTGAGVTVGVPMFVPPKSEHQLTITTRRLGPYRFTPFGTYEFAIRKQAGVEVFPWHVVVEYPETWRATSDVDLAKPGWLQYNTDLSRDGLLKVLFDTSL